MTTESRHNSTVDICRKTVDYEFFNVSGVSAKFYYWTVKTVNIGPAIRQVHPSTIILLQKKTIQKSSDSLLRFSIGSNVMDQRSGDERFIGRVKIFAIGFWKGFSQFRDALLWIRSSRIPSSRRRTVSRNRKSTKRISFHEEDRSSSWSTTTFEWLALMAQY